MRNTGWSQPTGWDTVCRRAKGRARHNAMRREMFALWYRWSADGKSGVQSLIAAHLAVHRFTISRDLRALMPGSHCSNCGQPRP